MRSKLGPGDTVRAGFRGDTEANKINLHTLLSSWSLSKHLHSVVLLVVDEVSQLLSCLQSSGNNVGM